LRGIIYGIDALDHITFQEVGSSEDWLQDPRIASRDLGLDPTESGRALQIISCIINWTFFYKKFKKI